MPNPGRQPAARTWPFLPSTLWACACCAKKAAASGSKKFSILDSDDVLSVLKDAGGTTDINTARQWQWTISLWKNQGLNAAQAAAAARTTTNARPLP